MDENPSFTWQPIDSIPLFYATISVMLEETVKQYKYVKLIKSGEYETDLSIKDNILKFYNKQLNKILYYEEQVKKWSVMQDLEKATKNTIKDLSEKLDDLKKASTNIIKISSEICENLSAQNNIRGNDHKKRTFFDFIVGKFIEE